MKLASDNARQAALATLDPKAAIDRGFLPGVCDGNINNTFRVSSCLKETISTQTLKTGAPSIQFTVTPSSAQHFQSVTAYVAGLPDQATLNQVADPLHAQFLAISTRIRMVACSVEVRSLTNPLDLNGYRVMCLGETGIVRDYDEIRNRKDVFLIGNNKAGEVTSLPWLPNDNSQEYRDIVSVSTDFYGCNFVNCLIETDTVGQEFEVSVWTIWELLPVFATLIPTSSFIGDRRTFSAALDAALEECPLYSHERVTYDGDGIIQSTASDVGTILGAGKDVYEAGKSMWDAGTKVVSGVTSLAGKIAGLFGAERKESSPTAADTYIGSLIAQMYQHGAFDLFMQLFVGTTKTELQVKDWCRWATGFDPFSQPPMMRITPQQRLPEPPHARHARAAGSHSDWVHTP